MILADLCNTSASYIGEIEIGKKFPSVEMVERIASALKVDAYRLFMEESGEKEITTDEVLYKMPHRIKIDLKNRLATLINADIEDVLTLTDLHPLQKSRLMKQSIFPEEPLQDGSFKIAQELPPGKEPSLKIS